MALVNKQLDGPRPLKAAILFQHEVPTIGMAAWGLDSFWSPQFFLIDLMGTCSQTGPALRQQLFEGLSVWAMQKWSEHGTLADFTKRSRLRWACLDCPSHKCQLGPRLANYVARVVKAQDYGGIHVESSRSPSPHPSPHPVQAQVVPEPNTMDRHTFETALEAPPLSNLGLMRNSCLGLGFNPLVLSREWGNEVPYRIP